MLMSALVEKRYLDATGRWDIEIGLEVRGKKDDKAKFVLGWTHEEVLAEIASKYISSYKDLPFAAYQIQTKFRNEPRAQSGLLRGREFIMKDLYSFHASEEDLLRYYEVVKGAYEKIFERCGLKSVYTLAAGGAFTASHTNEFQVLSPVGEDTILICSQCAYAENSEISKLKQGDRCPKCKGEIKEEKSIEVGNIFPLGKKYSEAFNLQFVNKDGKKEYVVMGSYGIGLGRTMAAIVETHYDKNGIIWPETVAPFQYHLLELPSESTKAQNAIRQAAEKVYEGLKNKGAEVLWDDRDDKTPGEKFADADLIGIPTRVVISEKTLEQKGVEVKKRAEGKETIMKKEELFATL